MKKKLLLAILLLFSISLANASFVALESTRGVGNDSWFGSLGMNFDVLSSINVTHLGAFDSLQNGFSSEIKVGVFDRNTKTLVTEVAFFNGTNNVLIGQSRFVDIVDVELGIGNYLIVAQGFNETDRNGTAFFGGSIPTVNTGNGLISFVGEASYGDQQDFEYPLMVDEFRANRYDAGTFQYEAVSNVPVPAAMWLFGTGLIGLFGMRHEGRSFHDIFRA